MVLYLFVFISRRLLAQLPEKTLRPIGPLCHTLFKISHERLTFNRRDINGYVSLVFFSKFL